MKINGNYLLIKTNVLSQKRKVTFRAEIKEEFQLMKGKLESEIPIKTFVSSICANEEEKNILKKGHHIGRLICNIVKSNRKLSSIS